MIPEPRPVIAEVVTNSAEYDQEADARWNAGLCVYCGQPADGGYVQRFCEPDGCGHDHAELPEPPESFTRSRCAYSAQRLRQRLQRAAGPRAGTPDRPRKAA